MSRIQVELLAPAWFNRFGDPLKSARVMEIITLVLKKLGFATYRYQHAWVVAPDPDGGYLIADHANKMAALDKGLPKRDRLTYHGVFRKTHLATALLIIKLGTFMWPGTQTFINVDNANPDLQETLRLGMHCLVWEHADVVREISTFKVLMASDNWDADDVMGDDELAIIARMYDAMDTEKMAVGVSKDKAIIRQVQRICSSLGTETMLYILRDYMKASFKPALDRKSVVA